MPMVKSVLGNTNPPEEEVVEPEPLTAQEIEEIRQAAHDEGFSKVKKKVLQKAMKKAKGGKV